MQELQKLSKEEKIKDLLQKREDTIAKIKELYKNFRGVSHENSSAEIKQVRIKVLEGFVDSLNKELISLGYTFKGRR
ncbi:MAG: hypothetical protein HYW33_01430 [Candidatus Blackburnbacteria bacterium]|uniref:50S ribosomal protein L29 n=1 Tax=Candidatus Blackburnbacteria bacterium RIFCSPHIGHO2_01_FULL_43_15b TaxID=1797513 RepID=A0A1G1V1X4_9BACT|nr:hypothetical protein [Candidatus Blackburnbacteria bacterium]OGY09402.1 MAG: hypothetical protein A2782_01100 [Candidatus Blackburnbacteria bacterium RIFCSPHIGHO2_01_FULL_43_15b]